MTDSFRHARSTCVLVLAAVFVGCGKRAKTVTVTGSVVRSGQPISLGPNGYIESTLQPDLPPDAAFTPKMTECDRTTGKFEVHEVVPGRYKIGIRQLDPDPINDKLKGAFSTASSGKIIREIDGKAPLDIDLAKPQ